MLPLLGLSTHFFAAKPTFLLQMYAQQCSSVPCTTARARMILQVLRTHRDTLLSVLETLVHDPLVEWVPKNAKGGAEEQENAMARDAMATIEGQQSMISSPYCC